MARRKARGRSKAPSAYIPDPGTHLGSFGSPREALDVTFGYLGEQIRVNPELSELGLMDWTEGAMEIGEDDPRAVTAVKDQVRELVHPDDFERFWAAARRHRQRLPDLLQFMQDLMSALTQRPTGRPSDSSAGPPSTTSSFADDSSSRAVATLEARGRPDLAVVVDETARSREVG